MSANVEAAIKILDASAEVIYLEYNHNPRLSTEAVWELLKAIGHFKESISLVG